MLIDEPDHQMVFGPNTSPPLGTPITLSSGAPITTLQVSVNGSTPQSVPSIVDSGGVFGTIPSSVISSLPPDSIITYYSSDGTELYSFATDGSNSNAPTVILSGLMNTGYYPFSIMPAYLSYTDNSGQGSLTFYQ